MKGNPKDYSLKHQIRESMRLKETDELVKIWKHGSHEEWSDTAFEIVEELLLERLGELPLQEPYTEKEFPEDEPHYKAIVAKDTEITQGLKIATHIMSIFSLPLLLGVFIITQDSLAKTGYGIVGLAVYISFLYSVAGGFDWRLEEISRFRLFFFLAVSGFYLGIFLYGLWYVIRKFVSDMFNVHIEIMKGKLFSGKWL